MRGTKQVQSSEFDSVLDATSWLDGGPEECGWYGTKVAAEIVGDSLEVLDKLEGAWRADPGSVWIGWLTYEFGREIKGERGRSGAPRLPGLCMRKYSDAVRLPPGAAPNDPRLVVGDVDPSWWPFESLRAKIDPPLFRELVACAKKLISCGDTYQVNLSQEFDASFDTQVTPQGHGDAKWLSEMAGRVFASLRARAPASMGALLEAGDAWIVSNSPERLLSVTLGKGEGPDVARSSPIKGTRRSCDDPEEDIAAIAELCACPKERAEHVMIVDLVRNDLGRCAIPGTVRTSPTPHVATLPTVHHLVTDVVCDLRVGWTLRGLVDAMFPGGSVTGAPKRRTMDIIDALEEGRREIYCGAIVVLHPEGLDMSIPIRTALLDKEGLWLRSGGGIVADSDPERERVETITKTRAFDPRHVAGPNAGRMDV